jgi:hypothetical protein
MCREGRDLIEHLEPGLHQFFPVEISRKRSKKPIYRLDGRALDEPYYFFNVQAAADAVCVEKSEVEITPMPDNRPPRIHRIHLPPSYNIVLLKSAISGHHVWRGRNQLPLDLLFSDTLVAAIQAAGLRKLDFHHLSEV